MTSATVDPRPKLFTGQHLPLVLGVIGLVTLGAFENRAVGTALPTMVREFDALGSFGLANAAPTASYLVSLSVLTLDLSDAGNSGRNSSATQMAGSMSIATAFAVSGTLLALTA